MVKNGPAVFPDYPFRVTMVD